MEDSHLSLSASYGRIPDRMGRSDVGVVIYQDSTGKQHYQPMAIITVGLPGRGKTFAARSLSRYLQWQGIQSKCFSVAEYRRMRFGEKLNPSYYDPSNQDLYKLRLELAHQALDDMITWLVGGGNGQVGIFDAANITRERRQMVHDKLAPHGIQVIFLEVICNQPQTILENFKNGAKYSPEYYGMDLNAALQDMNDRLSFYEPYYKQLDGVDDQESQHRYIQVTNVSERIITNRIFGYLPTKIAHYLMNINPTAKHILFLSESIISKFFNHKRDPHRYSTSTSSDYSYHSQEDVDKNDQQGNWPFENMVKSICSILYACIKGEPFNSPIKKKDFENFCNAQSHVQHTDVLQIWSGPSSNATRLAFSIHDKLRYLVFGDHPSTNDATNYDLCPSPRIRSQLSRLELSAFEKKKIEQLKIVYPEEYEKFIQDPYYHRFPGGESYHDLAIRLGNVLMELEGARSKVILLIADTSVLRCLYAYYTNVPSKDIPFIDIQVSDLLGIEPCAYGSIENRYDLGPESLVDNGADPDILYLPPRSLINCFRYTAS
jgi:broad specificity phosphatase PhoE